MPETHTSRLPADVPGEGDRAASAFYLEHFPFVWRNAQRMLGIDSVVDDVVQEVFIIAFRRLHEFEGKSSFRTWLYAILRRVAANHRRLHKKLEHDPEDLEGIATRES